MRLECDKKKDEKRTAEPFSATPTKTDFLFSEISHGLFPLSDAFPALEAAAEAAAAVLTAFPREL